MPPAMRFPEGPGRRLTAENDAEPVSPLEVWRRKPAVIPVFVKTAEPAHGLIGLAGPSGALLSHVRTKKLNGNSKPPARHARLLPDGCAAQGGSSNVVLGGIWSRGILTVVLW